MKVAVEGGGPAGLVDDVVVVVAERDEVGERGDAAVFPLDDVVGLGPSVGSVTAGGSGSRCRGPEVLAGVGVGSFVGTGRRRGADRPGPVMTRLMVQSRSIRSTSEGWRVPVYWRSIRPQVSPVRVCQSTTSAQAGSARVGPSGRVEVGGGELGHAHQGIGPAS